MQSEIFRTNPLLKEISNSYNNALMMNFEQLDSLLCNFYCIRKDGILLHCNRSQIISLNGLSYKDVINRKVFEFHNRDISLQLHQNNLKVIQANENYVLEEEGMLFRKIISYLSIKFPLYNKIGNSLGIFGVSVNIDIIPDIIKEFENSGLIAVKQQIIKLEKFLFYSKIAGIYLSGQETKCLYCLTRGFSAKDIGRIINLSHRTVEHYIENIKNKLGVYKKSDLILKALHSGYPYTVHIPIFPEKI